MKIYAKALSVLLLSGLSATGLHAQAPAPPVKDLGEPAPALTVGKWLKGGEVDGLKKGKVYVVEFWATWCLPCIAGMPHLSAVAHEFKDVTVIGCSILERKTTDLATIEKFVAGKRDTMDYHVAVDDGSKMADNWLKAYGERGIPFAFIVDKQNRIAWAGHPMNLDKILPQVVSGKWNVEKAAADRKDMQRLSKIDGNEVVTTLNKYMGRPGNPVGALARIDSFLKVEPGLKYYPKMGHFTFVALAKTNEAKALPFAKTWFEANNDAPSYATVTDAVNYLEHPSPEMYAFAAYCYQAQIDRYPWSMDLKVTYKAMADLYKKGGDEKKAAEFAKKSDAAPAGRPAH
ncbi:TlpA family protein disulfide reductase [Mucilaginibacter mali]|uniref:TlpA family protein disulfide reductase n=1 Tax=Mucilaginibacter mali TaxID=2740462 RepID=A0A7D4QI78_9SPHI|nr:TlpA disulfide reductase family protein [Mucilaginibacter mali]QKJ32592.1 TlpA family protein disulfide reductase [Mucilaginibacter mali]